MVISDSQTTESAVNLQSICSQSAVKSAVYTTREKLKITSAPKFTLFIDARCDDHMVLNLLTGMFNIPALSIVNIDRKL
jgi:hypothetical protein